MRRLGRRNNRRLYKMPLQVTSAGVRTGLGGTRKPLAMRGDEATPSSSAFGTLLRQHRLAVGLSQEELAARAQMSTQGIGALERGDRRNPQRGTLALLVRALGLNAEQRRAFELAAERPKVLRPGDGRAATLPPGAEKPARHNFAATNNLAHRAGDDCGRSRRVDRKVGAGDVGRAGRGGEDADRARGCRKRTRKLCRRRLAHRAGPIVERRVSSIDRRADSGHLALRRARSARIAGRQSARPQYVADLRQLRAPRQRDEPRRFGNPARLFAHWGHRNQPAEPWGFGRDDVSDPFSGDSGSRDEACSGRGQEVRGNRTFLRARGCRRRSLCAAGRRRASRRRGLPPPRRYSASHRTRGGTNAAPEPATAPRPARRTVCAADEGRPGSSAASADASRHARLELRATRRERARSCPAPLHIRERI